MTKPILFSRPLALPCGVPHLSNRLCQAGDDRGHGRLNNNANAPTRSANTRRCAISGPGCWFSGNIQSDPYHLETGRDIVILKKAA